MNRRFDDNGLGKLMKAWPLILSLAAVLMTFAIMQTTLQAHTEALKESKVDRIELRTRLIRVEAAMEMLPEMRQDIKTLLRGNRHANLRSTKSSEE